MDPPKFWLNLGFFFLSGVIFGLCKPSRAILRLWKILFGQNNHFPYRNHVWGWPGGRVMNKKFSTPWTFLSTFFPENAFFNFRMNHYFLGVAFNAPFDLSWGSRRLISFTYQNRCFMTIFRFRCFFSSIRYFLWFFKRTLSRFGLRSARFRKSRLFWLLNFY